MKGLAVYAIALYYEIPRSYRRFVPWLISFLAFVSCVASVSCGTIMAERKFYPQTIVPEDSIGDPIEPIAVPSNGLRAVLNETYWRSKRNKREEGGCATLDTVIGRRWYLSGPVKAEVIQVDPSHLRIRCDIGAVPFHTHWRDTVMLGQWEFTSPTDSVMMQIPVRDFVRCTPSWGSPNSDYSIQFMPFPAGLLVCGPNKYVVYAEKRPG